MGLYASSGWNPEAEIIPDCTLGDQVGFSNTVGSRSLSGLPTQKSPWWEVTFGDSAYVFSKAAWGTQVALGLCHVETNSTHSPSNLLPWQLLGSLMKKSEPFQLCLGMEMFLSLPDYYCNWFWEHPCQDSLTIIKTSHVCFIQSNSGPCWHWHHKAHVVSIHRKSWVRVTLTQNCGTCALSTVFITSQFPTCLALSPLQYRGSAWAKSGSGWHLSWTFWTSFLFSLPQLRSSSPFLQTLGSISSRNVASVSVSQVEFSTDLDSYICSSSEALCFKASLWNRRLSFISTISGTNGVSRRVVCRLRWVRGIGMQWASQVQWVVHLCQDCS